MTEKTPQEINDKINREYFLVFGDDNTILPDLEKHFMPPSLLKKDKNGRVDQHATLSAAGAYEVISFIKQRIKLGAIAK